MPLSPAARQKRRRARAGAGLDRFIFDLDTDAVVTTLIELGAITVAEGLDKEVVQAAAQEMVRRMFSSHGVTGLPPGGRR
jgi:hypothetical protein